MDALQMMLCGTLLRDRLSATDSSVIRAQHQTAGTKAGLRDRVLAAQEVASPLPGRRLQRKYRERPRSTSALTRQACPSGRRSHRSRHPITDGSIWS